MPAFICKTCGVQFAAGGQPPAHCPICDDERQYVGWQGQQWTTLDEMRSMGYHDDLREEESNLISIGTTPHFAIGQRALLVRTQAGNVLWDCISYLDDATVAAVRGLGGIQGIAMSHPHFYGINVEWSEAFDNAPIYIPVQDRQWVMRPSPNIRFFSEEALEIIPSLTLLRVGGHFDGAAVLHWPAGCEGRGALLTGDTITVVRDRRFVSFMYSYPNLIPLSERTIRHIVNVVRPFPFDRIYGAWDGTVVFIDGREALERSAERYIQSQQTR